MLIQQSPNGGAHRDGFSGASRGARVGFTRCRDFGGRRLCHRSASSQRGQHRLTGNGFALSHHDRLDDAGFWRDHLHHDFIGFDFYQQFVPRDAVARPFMPGRDDSICNRLWKGGRLDLDCHPSILLLKAPGHGAQRFINEFFLLT